MEERHILKTVLAAAVALESDRRDTDVDPPAESPGKRALEGAGDDQAGGRNWAGKTRVRVSATELRVAWRTSGEKAYATS